MADKAARKHMSLAISLAEKGRGQTRPNPLVGAVVVKGDRVVGQGYHKGAGKQHAERVALQNAGLAARSATLYVNLEPCCHTGRTSPCTEAILKAGISRVIYAHRDPDPRVNGSGARWLKKHGLEVSSGLMRKEAQRLNEIYLGPFRLDRPYIILKSAQTLDGNVATINGDSKWITGRRARELAHQIRSEVDAVVVGAGTVRRDNPALTVRLSKGEDPYRILISGSSAVPNNCGIIKNNADFKTIVVGNYSVNGGRHHNLIHWRVKTDSRSLVDLHDFVHKAFDFGIRSMLVEGGPSLATSFWKAHLVDKYVVMSAPMMFGEGLSVVGNLEVKKVSQAVKFDNATFTTTGNDCLFTGYPVWKK